jgi:hypothetical protein
MYARVKTLACAGMVFFMVPFTSCPPASSQQLAVNITTRSGLPPCNMDSFVYQAGAQAEAIYGDEGVHSKPPLSGFSKSSRINAGIVGINDTGLTTGHGSYMPDAWGADEFIDGPNGEWGQSGSTSNNATNNIYGMPVFTYTSPPLDPSNSYSTNGIGVQIPTLTSAKSSNGLYPVYNGYGLLIGHMTTAEVVLAQTNQLQALMDFYQGPNFLGPQQDAPTQ